MRLTFRLRTLLIVAPLVAAALAFAASRFIRHNEVTVVGLMDVRDQVFVSQWHYPPRDASDDLMERTSDEVLQRAIGSLSPTSRAWIEAKDDPIAWMRSNVHIRTIGKSNLLQASTFHFAPTAHEIQAETEIINALMNALGGKRYLGMAGEPRPDIQIYPAQVLRNGWF